MSAIGRALAYFNFAAQGLEALSVIKKLRSTPPPISRNSKATHGKRHASQKSRANRRKAGMKARARR